MMKNVSHPFATAAGLALVATLTGCGTGTTATVAPTPVTVSAGAQGIFMGGQQPVGNISIQLYAASTSAYAGAASPLLTAGSTKTTAAGNFTLPGFTCSSASSEVYIVGTGGNPIAGQAANNNLALISALGPCSTIGSNFINVNELTTVASVYALSGFMTGITNVGAPSSNTVGLTNAFAAVNKIVNTANGTLATPGGGNGGTIPTTLPSNATLPSALINTLADIIEQCVNSTGGSASDATGANPTGCGKLFYYTPNTAGTYPTDTITAMLNIAQHPTVNVAFLNGLRSASPVFMPVLSVNSPPTAFTIGIVYTGGGLNAPSAIAVDASGNVWAPNKGNNSVTKLDNVGNVLSGTTGFTAGSITAPAGIAIDLSGNAWVTNSTANTITRLAAAGTSGTVYSGNGLSSPKGIAIDSNNQVWVTNTGSGSGVSAFTNAGAAVSGSPFTGGGITTPASVATSAK